MLQKVERYTIYANLRDPHADENLAVIREGFSFWAFIFHAFYLLYKRQWLGLLVFLPLYVSVLLLGDYANVPAYVVAILQLGVQVWLGASAYDLHRAQYELMGWKLMDVAVAADELAAEQRYLDAKHALS